MINQTQDTQKFNLTVTENITFQEAMTFTKSLLQRISENQLNSSEIEKAIINLGNTKNGLRGFFVIYLTDKREIFNKPLPEIIKGLKASPIIVSELLTKNLAMSTAMKIAHRNNNNEDLAQSSIKVSEKTQKIIKNIQLQEVEKELNLLQKAINDNTGKYQNFLQKQNYNNERLQEIKSILNKIIKV